MPLRILALALLFVGCASGQLDSWNPPLKELKCTSTNPYLCADGHQCCTSVYPVCWGPDSEGYYCQKSDFNPDDPGDVLFGSKHRERATKRVDE